jgi:hypothetical protein
MLAMAKTKSKNPKWKSFEESAMQASSKIFGSQVVKADQEVMGTISQVLRQIDIKVGDEDFIDIECKDHAKPVDLPKVEQFANKLKDENAKSGIMISNSGFTKSALRTAAHYNIRPVALIDKGHANMSKFMLRAPVLAEGYYLDSISYGVSTSGVGQDFRFSPLVWDMKAAEGREKPRNIYEVFRDHWNDGTIEISKAGAYEYKFKQAPIVDLRGDTIIVDLTYRYIVKANIRKGYAGAESARGFYDINKQVFTSSEDITFEPIEIDKISDWPELSPNEKPSKQPFRLVGMFPLPDEPPLSSYTNPFTNEPLDPEKVKKGIYL